MKRATKVKVLCQDLDDLRDSVLRAHRILATNIQPSTDEDRAFQREGLHLLQMAARAIEECRIYIQDIH